MLTTYIKNNKKIKQILEGKHTVIKNTTDNFNIALLATDFLENEKSLFVVLPNLYSAQKYYDELIEVIDEKLVLFYPADELITAEMLMATGDFKYERINTIVSLLDNEKRIVITHYNGAIRYQFDTNKWKENIFEIKIGDMLDINELIRNLVQIGYKNVYTTTKTGEFSRRGSIVDIFPMNSINPVRLDFFGDEIDNIKVFDGETQKSIDKIDKIRIIPVTELLYSDIEVNEAISKINSFIEDNKIFASELEKIEYDKINLINRENTDLLMRYISFFTDNKKTIFDFIDNKKVYFIDYGKIEEVNDRMIMDLENYCSNLGGYNLLKMDYFLEYNKFIRLYDVVTEGLKNVFKDGIQVFAHDVISYKADRQQILTDLNKIYKGKTVIILIKNQARLLKLKETLLENYMYYTLINDVSNIKVGNINILQNCYFPSFELLDDDLVVINERNLFEIKYEHKKVKYKSIYQNATKISRYDELEIGDYVVHYDHGIGKYLGLKTMEMDGLKRDYIHVSYAKGGALYIPLEQINLIQKYAVYDSRLVKLNELGSSAWAKAKIRVRNKVHDISEKLIKLYASRQMSEGFAFLPDSTEQVLFESDFMYDLTADQEKAINDVKADMEKSQPMDRLICGDVGYGKTEVALRAAFKAVLSGKQVVVLAPTTILSRQHYLLFKERMEKFGLEVALLNRFVSAKDQKIIISKVLTGQVDVLIGTHRVLSDEIKFKDLGLLIVDEEQRFGVTHKEKIKELKINVDAITLSATPIPRTLQMSIVGVKDLSMIETPPKNRYPVQTYVLERNETVIKEAIIREIARGGQVFYMYNKVEDIDIIASGIGRLVPEARICIGHGKMNKDKLEKTLTEFIDKDYDVLVCTTIIETGLDIPDTNTIIIHDADKLGLSQLYQIRGRVGRSDKIAYAYMMYDRNKELNETAEKRLEAIKELTELGSGFKIAMRDLAIRGAGDLLGEEQSGFIESVGIEMYMKILEDEIKDRKGELEEKKVKDISLSEVYTSRHINEKYISNEDVRIEIHKKIDLLHSINDLDNIANELRDRFGDFDNELYFYMCEKLFKNLCDKMDIIKIDTKNKNTMILSMSEEKSNQMDGNKMFALANNLSKDISLKYINKQIQIIFDKAKYKGNEYLLILSKFLDNL